MIVNHEVLVIGAGISGALWGGAAGAAAGGVSALATTRTLTKGTGAARRRLMRAAGSGSRVWGLRGAAIGAALGMAGGLLGAGLRSNRPVR